MRGLCSQRHTRLHSPRAEQGNDSDCQHMCESQHSPGRADPSPSLPSHCRQPAPGCSPMEFPCSPSAARRGSRQAEHTGLCSLHGPHRTLAFNDEKFAVEAFPEQ